MSDSALKDLIKHEIIRDKLEVAPMKIKCERMVYRLLGHVYKRSIDVSCNSRRNYYLKVTCTYGGRGRCWKT